LSRFVDNWKHRLGLESARAALCKWANCTRQTFLSLNFCKLTKQTETIRNHQNRFWLWLTIVWETYKLTRYQSREFSCYIVKSEQTQKHTRKLTTSVSRSYYSFSARDWSLVFDPEKPTFSVSSEHKTTYKCLGPYSLPYSLPSPWKIRKRISQLSPFDHATWQHPDKSPRHVRESARICDVRMAQFVLKIDKLSHIIGARESRDLRSPSPIMAPHGSPGDHVIYICYLPAGRSVWWKTVTEILKMLRPRAAFSSPRSQFFTIWTDPKPANNIYILHGRADIHNFLFSCWKIFHELGKGVLLYRILTIYNVVLAIFRRFSTTFRRFFFPAVNWFHRLQMGLFMQLCHWIGFRAVY